MALKLNTLEPTGTRWNAPSEQYPQGSFKNGSGQGKRDGSYAKAEWANDIFGFLGAILKNGQETPNGQVENADASQIFTALKKIMKSDIDTFGGDPTANASGTVNAITATFTKPIALEGGKRVQVRAMGANTSTDVTFNPNNLGAKPVVKGDGSKLAVGDIASAGFWMTMIYDATLQKWILQNPATGVKLVLPDASTDTKGIIQIATGAEVTNGLVADKAIVPKDLKTELDKKAPKANPTFTGSVIVPTPTQNDHAATKKYVDDRIVSPNAYIKESWHSGTSWYRIWSDGWIEQGGYEPAPPSVTVLKPVSFFKKYKSTPKVNISRFLKVNAKYGSLDGWSVSAINENGFKYNTIHSNALEGTFWEAKGY